MVKRFSAVLRVSSLVLMAGVSGCTGRSSTGPVIPGETFTFRADVANAWFELAYDLAQDEKFSPPRASRAFAYSGVSLYEAVVPGMPDYESLAGRLNDLGVLPEATDPPYHWPSTANAALAVVMRGMFENTSNETTDAVDDLEEEFATQFNNADWDDNILARSVSFGRAIGLAILEWSRRDGYTTFHNCDDYEPTGTDGRWEPTPPGFAGALEPCWGQMRPFVLESPTACDQGPPPAYSEDPESDFWTEAVEVYETVNSLTAEQLAIAEYWADNPGMTGTPPGHSIMIAVQVLEQEEASLELAAETFAKVGMATADAFIACWWSKYEYDLVRPVTCVWKVMLDSVWLPVVGTPPFPEYTSGHSVQSGAASQVLTDLFGDNFHFIDRTHEDMDLPARTFDSFYEFADEAAISRLYGGIHFRSAIELGVVQGRCIGSQISAVPIQSDATGKRVIALTP